MFRKSLYLTGALTGALLWSVAAQAAPGQPTGNVNMQSGRDTAYSSAAQFPAAVVDIAGRGNEHRRHIYRYYGEDPYAYYNEDPYAYPDYGDNGPTFGGFGFGFGGHGGHGFGGHGGGGHDGGGYGGGMGGGHGGGGHGGGGGGHGR